MSKKSIGLDLSKFKHVKSDDKSTTLKHYEGHEITLAHRALSKAHQEALKAMADKAQAKAEEAGESVQKYAEGGKTSIIDNFKSAFDKPKNGKNPSEMSTDNFKKGMEAPEPRAKDPGPITNQFGSSKYAEGGDVAPVEEKPLDFSGLPDVSTEGINQTLKAIDQYPAERMENFKKAGYDDPFSQQQLLDKLDQEKAATTQAAAERSAVAAKGAQDQFNTLAKLAQQKQAHGIPLSPAEQDAIAPRQPASVMPSAEMKPEAAVQNAAAQAGPVQQPQANPNDPESMLQSGYNKQMAGINQAATAQGALGNAQAALLEKQAVDQATAKAHYDETYKTLDSERQALMQDVQEGHIDPNKYWEGDPKTGEGGHSRIMAGIGMILAGFNPTTRPNAAIEYINKQMDMNLLAQQKNLDSKQNLLSHNLQQFRNLKDATEMTRIMQNDIVAHQLQAAAAKAQTPMAKAAALQAAGQLQAQSAPLFQQFAMRRAMVNLANSPSGQQSPEAVGQMISYMRMTNPEMAKEMESRFVPGVGLASVPVPQEARTEMIGKQNFDQMAKHYIQWVKQNANSLNPAKINEGATLAAELQGAYRMSTKGGTYKEGEQEFIEKLIPSDPAQFAASIRTLPKVEALVGSNQAQLDQLRKGYGLPGQQQQVQPTEPQIKTMGGVKYMQVPGGWKKVK